MASPLVWKIQGEVTALQNDVGTIRAHFAQEVDRIRERVEGVSARQHKLGEIMQSYVGRLDRAEERVADTRAALKDAVEDINKSTAKDVAHVTEKITDVGRAIDGLQATLGKLVWIVVGALVPMAIAGLIYSIVQVTPALKHAWHEGSVAPPAAAATVPPTKSP